MDAIDQRSRQRLDLLRRIERQGSNIRFPTTICVLRRVRGRLSAVALSASTNARFYRTSENLAR